jgi:C2 domain
VRLGQTEIIENCLDPQWVKQFDVQYHFEQRELFRVMVYDVDDFKNVNNFNNHDFIGSLEFTLHEVVTMRDQTLEKPLENIDRPYGKSGIIRITGEESKRGDQVELIMKPHATFE